MNQWLVAALWVALALAAGLISLRTAISVSLLEIAMGVFGGNFLRLHPLEWTNFLGFMGHSRIFERVWGSTSQNLTRLAPCSVLVAK